MNQPVPGSDQPHITAWDVFRARRAPEPPNPLRYSHNLWFALAVIAFSIALAVAVVPARIVESNMLEETRGAKTQGFPDLPPAYATDEQLANWKDRWNLFGPDAPDDRDIVRLSFRVGEYGDDSAILNLGVMGNVLALNFLAAVGFGRALNNLTALGYGASRISPAWGFVSWLIPILSFILPWRMVSEAFHCSWFKPLDEPESRPRWPLAVAAIWGVAYALFWLLNPVSVNLFFPRDDIDQWITHLEWEMRMLAWLPIPGLLTGLMLLVVAMRQHARYRELDQAANRPRIR